MVTSWALVYNLGFDGDILSPRGEGYKVTLQV